MFKIYCEEIAGGMFMLCRLYQGIDWFNENRNLYSLICHIIATLISQLISEIVIYFDVKVNMLGKSYIDTNFVIESKKKIKPAILFTMKIVKDNMWIT